MKKLLKRLTILFLIVAVNVASLFGCEFSFSPKEKVIILADNNSYKSPYNALSLVENIQKKMNNIQAFEVNGTFEDGSSLFLSMIAQKTLKTSSFSMIYTKKDDYSLKANLRNEKLYFKVPLNKMGIDSTLNLGIKESVDDFIHYMPMFSKSLGFEFLNISEEEYENIFNKVDYFYNFIDYLLNLGKTSFGIDNNQYVISVDTKDNLQIVVNKDYSIKNIITNECNMSFSYPKVGEYILEYPGEIVGIGYVTLESIEESLGDTFDNLLK